MAEQDYKSKIVDWPALLHRRRQAYAEKRVVVWTNGCFDLLHVGHIRILQTARSFGDLLVVGLNSDSSVRALKGPSRPIMSASDRAEILSALACVDYVIVFDEITPVDAIRRLTPDVHCKGVDYKPPFGKPIPEARIVQSYGGRIEFIPLDPPTSTSDLIRQILSSAACQSVDQARMSNGKEPPPSDDRLPALPQFPFGLRHSSFFRH